MPPAAYFMQYLWDISQANLKHLTPSVVINLKTPHWWIQEYSAMDVELVTRIFVRVCMCVCVCVNFWLYFHLNTILDLPTFTKLAVHVRVVNMQNYNLYHPVFVAHLNLQVTDWF